MEKQPTKTEAELIASVANIHDAEACLRFAQRAIEKGHLALAAACHERAQALKPIKAPGVKKKATQGDKGLMKTHATVELALPILIEDYKTGKDPTTYGELADRCGVKPGRWFGQVTDLIDAACALVNVPSFALVRVRQANGNINDAAFGKEYSHLRDRIIATATAGSWTDEDFAGIKNALAEFSSLGFGHKKAWDSGSPAGRREDLGGGRSPWSSCVRALWMRVDSPPARKPPSPPSSPGPRSNSVMDTLRSPSGAPRPAPRYKRSV